MAAKLFFLPYTVATVNGIAQPAATLTFYQTGTLTKLPIYTTALLDVQLANPITASGGGRFPDIYLDDTQTYRMIVKDQIGTVLDDVDPYIPGTIAGLVGPTGPAGGGEAIYLTPLEASEAALIEGLIAATANGAEVWFPLGTTTLDRSVIPAKPTTFRGYGGAKGQSGGTGRTHIVAPAGFPAFVFGPNAQQSRVEDMVISQTSILSTTQLGTYSGLTPFNSITLNAAGDFQNGQVIQLEGAGGSMVLKGRTAAVMSGSNSFTVTSSGSYGNYWGYVGQMVSIAGAGPAAAALVGYIGTISVGGAFTLVNAAGAALNAGTMVTTAAITVFAPMVGRIVSGGGTTTLTVDAWAANPSAVTSAVIRHCAPAIYSVIQCHGRNVDVGGDCQTGLILAGVTTGGNVADNCTFVNCIFAGLFGGVILQGNDAQVNSFFGCNFAGPLISVLDNSLLGNYFYGCHWAFNCGLQSFNAFDQIIGGYFESNTGWTAAGGLFVGTMSLVNGAGLLGVETHALYLGMPQLQLAGPIIASDDGSGSNIAAQLSGGVLSQGTGKFIIKNNRNAYGGSSTSIGNFDMWINGGTSPAILWAHDDSNADIALQIIGLTVDIGLNGDITGTFGSTGLNLLSGKVLSVNGTQVVGPRDTGWTADTGTAKKTANATYAAGTTLTYSAAYVQAEQTAMATRMAAVEAALQNIAQTQKALKDASIAAGSIGT